LQSASVARHEVLQVAALDLPAQRAAGDAEASGGARDVASGGAQRASDALGRVSATRAPAGPERLRRRGVPGGDATRANDGARESGWQPGRRGVVLGSGGSPASLMP
jgi:hypothetical protein